MQGRPFPIMRRVLLSLTLGLLCFSFSPDPPSKLRARLPADFIRGFDALLQDYLQLKDALVADNTWGAALAGSRILTTMPAISTTGLNAKEQASWQCFAQSVRPAADQISGASNIELQRWHFKPLSGCFIAALDVVGAGGTSLFRQHCPMADAGRGADWLSLHREIQNPYYGVKMLHCGRVQAHFAGRVEAAPLPEGHLAGKLNSAHVHGCHGAGR